MASKVKLTKRSVDAASHHSDLSGFSIVWDTEIPGYGLRITHAGVKSYILQYRLHGRQRKYTIGRHGDLTANQYRQIALDLRSQIAKGHDPQETKHKERGVPTLDRFATEYLDTAKQTKKTWKKDQAQLNQVILPELGKYRLNSITTRQIEKLHNGIKQKRAPATANRYLALIKHMFNLAVKWGYIETSPAQNIKLFKENNERTSWLNDEQVKALFLACEADPNPYTGALFPFLLFTGARLGEALAARWDNMDLERAMWFIPDAKSGRGRYVPLSDQAITQLKKLSRQSNNPHVFCGHVKSKSLVNATKPWRRVREAAGIPEHFRIHDLRHTFASWGVSNGVDLYHIQALLGHSTAQMTQRYSHLAESGIKASVNHISGSIQTAMETKNKTKETHG